MDPNIIELYNGYIGGDTSQTRFDESAAQLAWQRSIHFFRHYLG